ncbi:MAG: DUF711 family protein [Anaerolineae bacterium]
MKIRSITLFAELAIPFNNAHLAQLGEAARALSQSYQDAGYEVQTLRLATDLWGPLGDHEAQKRAVDIVKELEARCRDAGFEYVAIGPAGPGMQRHVPELLAATESVFVTCHIAKPEEGRIDGEAIRAASQIIREASDIEDGFGNLRFAALANVRAGTPFFPAAYWHKGPPAFAIATEAADLAVVATEGTQDAAVAHARLSGMVESHGRRLQEIGFQAVAKQDLDFLGIDFSPAPYPSPEISIGAALEALSQNRLGSPGTLTAAALLTDAIQRADFLQTGFCGLMLPVLEDVVLASRAAEGTLRISDLLQWSAVCGTGLDTVPLAGDVSEASLAALLFDVAALSVRLNKPLTARLMPLPGKAAGDPVHFDFSYFADGGVLELAACDRDTAYRETTALQLRALQQQLNER